MYFNDEQLNKIGIDDAKNVKLTHLPLSEEAKADAATTLEATDITTADIHPEEVNTNGSGDFLQFETGGFSVFAITGEAREASLRVSVVWIDGENESGKRPDSVNLTLQRRLSGESNWENYLSAEATQENSYNCSIESTESSPISSENGSDRLYEYRIVESIPDGYISKSDGVAEIADDQYVITNILKPEKVRVDVEKTWNVGGVTSDDIYTGFTASLERKTAKAGSSYTAVEGVGSVSVPSC